MLSSYIKIAGRNLRKNRIYSFINILGLSMGMAVTLLIGLWVWDELSFNKYHDNYDRIAMVLQRNNANGHVYVQGSQPPLLADGLERNYGSRFSALVMSSGNGNHNISYGDKKFFQQGSFMGAQAPDMLSLQMVKGTHGGLSERHSILLAASMAKSLFGDMDPMNKTVMIDHRVGVTVTGVYDDIPVNSDFANTAFICPWDLFSSEWKWVHDAKDNWDFNAFTAYVQMAPNQDMEKVSKDIGNLKNEFNPHAKEKYGDIFLYPMSRWHLYDNFDEGKSAGGQIKYVLLFGAIGVFVLLLACINFMNLSTARSEKRAREVGIRKAIGSVRRQLVFQFLSESTVVAILAFVIALLLVQLALPMFNQLAGKNMSILWSNPWFWMAGIGFSVITGIIAGSYPAFYLSSFRPVKVLKGEFKVGRFAALPRKVLVVVQFTVSVLLVAGTVIVYRQIQYAKDRPVGFERKGLISIPMTTGDIYKNYDAARNELLASRLVSEVSESQGPITDNWVGSSDVIWTGKDVNVVTGFAQVGATIGYGKAIGWKITAGRDFSTQYASDTNKIIINESAARVMGFKDPVGQMVRLGTKDFTILGVVKDVLMQSPYAPVSPTIFYVLTEPGNFVIVKIAPGASASQAMKKIQSVFERYNPAAPFICTFADEDFAKKFGNEERIARLATIFATLAIIISCLGLFGLSAFMAERRTKEIGIRKVLGATVYVLWRMLSSEFVVLVVLSCCIAIPITWHFLDKWLQQFDYRIRISWVLFLVVGMGALLLALATVSYQAVRAALANPIKSLRTE